MTTKPQNSNVLPACIVGACLLASALVVTRPQASAREHDASNSGARPLVTPPFSQEEVKKQSRRQLLAAPTVHAYKVNGKTFTLSDIDVTRVTYNSEKDYFTVSFHWVWKEGKAPESWDNSASLSNDGYGHYWGPAVLSPILNGTGQNADVTIQ